MEMNIEAADWMFNFYFTSLAHFEIQSLNALMDAVNGTGIFFSAINSISFYLELHEILIWIIITWMLIQLEGKNFLLSIHELIRKMRINL